MQGIFKGAEGCLVIWVQDRALVFMELLQEAAETAQCQCLDYHFPNTPLLVLLEASLAIAATQNSNSRKSSALQSPQRMLRTSLIPSIEYMLTMLPCLAVVSDVFAAFQIYYQTKKENKKTKLHYAKYL